MKRLATTPSLLTLLFVFTAAAAFAQTEKPRLFITPAGDGFEVYLAAAMLKKGVPVSVIDKPDTATYTLKAAQIEIQKESGASKFARCLFAYCIGIEDKGSTSVQLVDRGGVLVWSYSVNKGRGQKNRQSMAEAIAKHLKDEYFALLRHGEGIGAAEGTRYPPFVDGGHALKDVATAPPATSRATPATGNHPGDRLTNKDILDMASVGLGDEVILAKIATSALAFETAPEKLIELRKAGVSDKVIAAMVRAPARTMDVSVDASAQPAKADAPSKTGSCESIAERLKQVPGNTLAARIRAANPGSFQGIDDARLEKIFMTDFPCLQHSQDADASNFDVEVIESTVPFRDN